MTPIVRGLSKLRIEALFLLGQRVPHSLDTIVASGDTRSISWQELECLAARMSVVTLRREPSILARGPSADARVGPMRAAVRARFRPGALAIRAALGIDRVLCRVEAQEVPLM